MVMQTPSSFLSLGPGKEGGAQESQEPGISHFVLSAGRIRREASVSFHGTRHSLILIHILHKHIFREWSSKLFGGRC